MTTSSEPSGNDSHKTVEGENTKQVDTGAELIRLQALVESTAAERDKLRVANRELKATSGSSGDLQKQLDALMTEKSKLAEDFEGYKSTIKKQKLETHVSTALEAAGVKSKTLALKVLDMSKIEFDDSDNVKVDSITAAIEALKTAEPVLFGEVQADPNEQSSGTSTTPKSAPAPKVAAQGSTGKSSYETEIQSAKSVKEIEAVMRKYSKA
jgi:ABC-type transporter Mla subunit MlaD